MGNKSYWMNDEEYKTVTKMTPIPTVNLIILRQGKDGLEILLLVRKTGYAKGQWCTIGGRVWLKETLKEAIDRHGSDLGVKVTIIPPFSSTFPSFVDDRTNQDKTKHPISLVFPAEIVSGTVRDEGDEYQSSRWFSIIELPKIGYGQKLQIQKTLENIKKFDKTF